MKICHVTSVHSPEDGRIFRRACTSCARAGYETYLVEKGESYTKNGVHIIGLKTPLLNNRLYRMTFFSLKAFIMSLRLNADLYHLHDPELLIYALLYKAFGKKVVFDSHENYLQQIRTKEYLPYPLRICISFLFDKYSRFVFKRIDGLTYPCVENNPYFLNLCPRVCSTDNLPWLDELYEKYDSSVVKENKTACYIGGLDESRGLTQMIKASYLAGFKLYLAGPFSSEAYRDKITSLEEYSCVEYLGIIDRNEVLNLLNHVQVGLCTLLDVGQYYKMNNLPTKVYEYMSMSIPTILNDSPYNISFNEKYKIGVCVSPKNISLYAKALSDIVDDPHYLDYGQNGRRLIKDKMCWDIEQDNLLNMYNSIFNE